MILIVKNHFTSISVSGSIRGSKTFLPLETHLYLRTDLKLPLLSSLLKCLIAGLSFTMVWLDVAVFHTEILELSFTEITQEVMLFLCAILFWTASGTPEKTGFDFLAAGAFTCLLMRELDGLFDLISHSAWLWPFLGIAATAIFMASRAERRAETVRLLASFIHSRTFATLSTGMAVLIFSRIFGMGTFWHHVLGADYQRLAKTTAEEGVELMAYSIWLSASLEYWVNTRLVRSTLLRPSGFAT